MTENFPKPDFAVPDISAVSQQRYEYFAEILMDDTYRTNFFKRVRIIEGGCWQFTGGAKFRIRNKQPTVRKAAYQLWRGPLPEGFRLATCSENQMCVNPFHLTLIGTDERTRFASMTIELYEEPNACLYWKGKKNEDGYGRFRMDDGTTEWAHRAAMILEHGNIPEDNVVRHLCNNRYCVRVGHLAFGSRKDNMQDKAASGRAFAGNKAGEANPNAELTNYTVYLMRLDYLDGNTVKEISERYRAKPGPTKRAVKNIAYLSIAPDYRGCELWYVSKSCGCCQGKVCLLGPGRREAMKKPEFGEVFNVGKGRSVMIVGAVGERVYCVQKNGIVREFRGGEWIGRLSKSEFESFHKHYGNFAVSRNPALGIKNE